MKKQITLLSIALSILSAHAQSTLNSAASSGASFVDGFHGSEWNGVVLHDASNLVYGTAPGSGADFSVSWGSLWDLDYLYVIAKVTDDTLSTGNVLDWENDSVELFLDGDASGGSSYDGLNDYQFVWEYEDMGSHPTYGLNSRTDATGVISAGALGLDGYVFEAAIPWTLLLNGHAQGLTEPYDGMPLGFNIHVNDADGSNMRERTFSWSSTANDSWQNPGSLGLLQTTPVPEPATVSLLIGAMALAFVVWRRRRG